MAFLGQAEFLVFSKDAHCQSQIKEPLHQPHTSEYKLYPESK